MIHLGVNPKGIEWQAVCKYVEARRKELVEAAIDLGLPRENRDEACARIAELDELLIAPGRTIEILNAEAIGRDEHRSVY